MLRFRLADLPENLREQAEKQLAPSSSIYGGKVNSAKKTPEAGHKKPVSETNSSESGEQDLPGGTEYIPAKVKKLDSIDHRGTPNKTEAEYNDKFLGGKGRYEAVTLHLPGGNYTPDWMTDENGVLTLTEVKGAFRFGSQSRAILAFKEAAALYPFWRFVWATKKKGGVWDIKQYSPGQIVSSVEDN